MMRVVDYIANYIHDLGIKQIFMVTGGGMMFLSDAIASQPAIEAVCCHHEQACAMAAVAYSKYSQDLGVVFITSGCGSTNTITGLMDAWQDNVPCLFISGQAKRNQTVGNSNLPLRQFGVQEVDIISVVKPLTKYAVTINDPEMVAYHLDMAIRFAKSGRQGPVWLDIPLDVQAFEIDESNLVRVEENQWVKNKDYKENPTDQEVELFSSLLKASSRPVIIAGQGIRLSKSIQEFKRMIEEYSIPVVSTYLGIDLLPSDHKLYIGRLGNKGTRAGNLAVQNSDLVIVLGSRLSVSSTGHDYKTFAREATIVVVDIDSNEHKKNTVKIDVLINADIKEFINAVLKSKIDVVKSSWTKTCLDWKNNYPVCLPEYKQVLGPLNTYYFIDQLSKKMKSNSIVVSDAGSAFYVVAQSIKIRGDQRHITSGAQGDMGFTLPACIGASIAGGYCEVIGITGEGSFQMNIQELQTIVHNKLPIKLFIWNNNGYSSIRATQAKFFQGRLIGADKTSGISFPEIEKIANAYGIKYIKVTSENLDSMLDDTLNYSQAVICEVMCVIDQEVIPTVSSIVREDGTFISKPLEDMYPFLERDEFKKTMIITPINED